MKRDLMQYDVIIVGTGPAGTSAALEFARKSDLHILIIDKETLPREKPCGGAMPSSVEILLDLDLAPVIKNRIQQLKLYHNYEDEVGSQTLNDNAPILVNRAEFDMFMLNQACGAGKEKIKVLDGVSVLSVSEKEDKIYVFLSDKTEVKTKYLIAADGALGKIASMAGLMKKRKFAQSYDAEIVTENTYYNNHKDTMLMNYFCLPHGYGWIFPKEKNIFSSGVGTWGKSINIKRELDDFINRSFPRNVIKSINVKGYPIPIYNGGKQISTNRVLLTGDAAALVDPVSGEGIRFALHSGKIAASVIIKSLEDDMELSGMIVSEEYQKEVNEKIGKELKFKLSFASLAFHSSPQMFYKAFVKKPY